MPNPFLAARMNPNILHSRLYCAIVDSMIRIVHLPCNVGQDEDGVWCASARLRPGVGAVGDGATREAAIADLCAALDALLEVADWPCELAGEGLQSWEGK